MEENRMSVHEWITLAYIAVMLTVYLFFVGKDGYLTIAAEKFSAFCWISGSYIILCLFISFEQMIIGASPFPSLRSIREFLSLPRVLVLSYLVLTGFSAITSEYWPNTLIGATRFEGALTITLYGSCFLLVSKYGRIRREIIFLLGGSLSIHSLICIAQMQGVNLFGLFPEGYTYLDANVRYYGAYIGTIGNVDVAASLYSLVIPLLVYIVITQKTKERYFLFIPLLLSLYVVIRIQVKAGYVGVAAGCFLAIPLLLGKTLSSRIRLTLCVVTLILMALAALFFFDPGSGMFHELHEILHGNIDPNFGTGRIHIWSEVLKRVPEHLWLGTGPDTMAYEGIEGFIDYDARLGEWIAAKIDFAHNEYLNVLYHQGILALIAYVSLLFSIIAKAWIIDEPAKGKTAALIAGIIGYSTQAFFGSSVCVTASYFWLVLALAVKEMPPKTERSQKKMKKGMWKKLVSLNLAIILLLSILSVGAFAEESGQDEDVQTAVDEVSVPAEEKDASDVRITYKVDGKSVWMNSDIIEWPAYFVGAVATDNGYQTWNSGEWYESEKAKHLLFEGWCTTPDGTGEWYVPDERVTHSVTLYPQWIDQPTSEYYYAIQLGFNGERTLYGLGDGNAVMMPEGKRCAVVVSMSSTTEVITLPSTAYHQAKGYFCWAKNAVQGQLPYRSIREIGTQFFNEGDEVTVSSGDIFTEIPGAAVNFYENKKDSNELKKYRLI